MGGGVHLPEAVVVNRDDVNREYVNRDDPNRDDLTRSSQMRSPLPLGQGEGPFLSQPTGGNRAGGAHSRRRLLGLAVLFVAVSGCARDRSVIAIENVATPTPPHVEILAQSPAVASGPIGDEHESKAGRQSERQGKRTFHVAQGHPRADDANPGTEAAPWRTISRATGRGVLRPGDAVVIHGGTYRETVEPQEGGRAGSRITFRAAPGEFVVISGADLAPDWERQPDGSWVRPWMGGEMRTYAEAPVFRRELVVADGEVLRPVFSRADLREGTFWVEGPPEAPRAIHARFGAALPAEIQVAHRTYGFRPLGPDRWVDCGDPSTPGFFHLVGLTFRHHANRAQWGALCAGRAGSLVEDVSVEWTNGLGISISGRDHTFRRTSADHNGQMGWGGACRGCLLEDTRAERNNWKGHDPFWEAGGSKFVRTSQTVVRRHLARGNGGPGIWFDIDNHDNTVENCTVEGNEVAGIMLELRTVRTLVQHNTVRATRWRAWSGTGILSQAASHNVILHNTVTGNEGTGIWLRLDPDRRAPDGATLVARNRVRGNVTRRDVEARELSVEGTGVEHVRSNEFWHNEVGRVGDAEPLWRSSFHVHPVPGAEAGFRNDDLAGWRRVANETGTTMERGAALPTPGPFPEAGAQGTRPRAASRTGADGE